MGRVAVFVGLFGTVFCFVLAVAYGQMFNFGAGQRAEYTSLREVRVFKELALKFCTVLL